MATQVRSLKKTRCPLRAGVSKFLTPSLSGNVESIYTLQIVYYPDAAFLLPAAHLDTVPLLERETYVRVVRHHLQIHALAEPDLASEFRGSYLGHETV